MRLSSLSEKGAIRWAISPLAASDVLSYWSQSRSRVFHKPWKLWLDTRIYPRKGGIVVFRADASAHKLQELIAREREQKLKESEDLLRLATAAAAITFDYHPQAGAVMLPRFEVA